MSPGSKGLMCLISDFFFFFAAGLIVKKEWVHDFQGMHPPKGMTLLCPLVRSVVLRLC